jgi:hypothetical protein
MGSNPISTLLCNSPTLMLYMGFNCTKAHEMQMVPIYCLFIYTVKFSNP